MLLVLLVPLPVVVVLRGLVLVLVLVLVLLHLLIPPRVGAVAPASCFPVHHLLLLLLLLFLSIFFFSIRVALPDTGVYSKHTESGCECRVARGDRRLYCRCCGRCESGWRAGCLGRRP